MNNEWISVEKELPALDEIVLGFGFGELDKIKTWDFCQVTKKGFKMLSAKKVKITHWMPLPSPPKP